MTVRLKIVIAPGSSLLNDCVTLCLPVALVDLPVLWVWNCCCMAVSYWYLHPQGVGVCWCARGIGPRKIGRCCTAPFPGYYCLYSELNKHSHLTQRRLLSLRQWFLGHFRNQQYTLSLHCHMTLQPKCYLLSFLRTPGAGSFPIESSSILFLCPWDFLLSQNSVYMCLTNDWIASLPYKRNIF